MTKIDFIYDTALNYIKSLKNKYDNYTTRESHDSNSKYIIVIKDNCFLNIRISDHPLPKHYEYNKYTVNMIYNKDRYDHQCTYKRKQIEAVIDNALKRLSRKRLDYLFNNINKGR